MVGPIEPMAPAALEPEDQTSGVRREDPDLPLSREQFVEQWIEKIRGDKKHWDPKFRKMRKLRDFVYGRQWSEREDDDRFVVNIVLRHTQQRTANLYAKNPKAVSRVRERLYSTVWDGSMAEIMSALETITMAQQTPGVAQDPGAGTMVQEAMQVLADAKQTVETKETLAKFARTLELLYEYAIHEQSLPFKAMMKLTVRRAITTAVAYAKLGFKRVMEPSPEQQRNLADATQRLARLEQLATDVQDGELDDETKPEIEELRVLIDTVQRDPEIIAYEGLTFDYPDATSIIPDRRCVELREFLGCAHVTQEYVLTPDEVQQVYGVDLRKAGFTPYRADKDGGVQSLGRHDPDSGDETPEEALCVVWETYCKADGNVYVTCDGYRDFLREPGPPEIWTERFWPWFPLVLNEVDHPKEVIPPSDVEILMDIQKEYNRLREGLREHRKMNRPGTVSPAGTLSEDDKHVLQTRPGFAHVELDGLQPGQRLQDVLGPLPMPGVDPNLYEVNPIFQDMLRTVGTQEANLGGAAGGTATESSIAESSRMSAEEAAIDEVDDFLTRIARTAGQILLTEMSVEKVKEIVGPGAVWPDMSREQLAKEIFLETEAGSSGRPNQAQEIQNFERLAPIIMQIPGIRPDKFAQEAIRRLDDRLDITDLYDENLPAMAAMNQIAGAAGGGAQQNAGPNAPAQQGQEGSNTQQSPDRTAGAPGGPDMPSGAEPPPGVQR